MSPKIDPLADTEKTMEATSSRNNMRLGTFPTEDEPFDTIPTELRTIPEFQPAFAAKIDFLRSGCRKADPSETQPAPDHKLLTILDSHRSNASFVSQPVSDHSMYQGYQNFISASEGAVARLSTV